MGDKAMKIKQTNTGEEKKEKEERKERIEMQS